MIMMKMMMMNFPLISKFNLFRRLTESEMDNNGIRLRKGIVVGAGQVRQ